MASFFLIENSFRRGVMLIVFLFAGTLAGSVFAQTGIFRLVPESSEEESYRMISVQEMQTNDEDAKYMDAVDLDLLKPLADIHVDIQSTAPRTPEDHSNKLYADLPSSNYPGSFQTRLAAWEAPNIRYQPLYFQDVSLERYGYTRGPILQPFESAAYFGASFLLLPVELVRDRPGRCVTPLGFCRPGSPAPYTQRRWLIQR